MFAIDNASSVIRVSKKRYSQILLEECKYKIKKANK